MAVPIVLAIMARRSCRRCSCGVTPPAPTASRPTAIRVSVTRAADPKGASPGITEAGAGLPAAQMSFDEMAATSSGSRPGEGRRARGIDATMTLMTDVIRHLTMAELEAGLDEIRRSPRDAGELKLIVRRPGVGIREDLETGDLDVAGGLVGDTWRTRRSRLTPDGSPHPDTQLNVMN